MEAFRRSLWVPSLFFAAGLLIFTGCSPEHRFVKRAAFKGSQRIMLTFAGPVDEAWAKDISNYRIYGKPDPDILLQIRDVTLSPDGKTVVLNFDEELNQTEPHILTVSEISSEGESMGTAIVNVKKFYLGVLFSILMGAMVINNFVFTKYLGLCVFFGTSQKKSTAVGMGITFTTLSVQAVDTILRKVNPVLFKAFGVYLVLVIANCIVIAVPLILADNEYNAWESLMLASGAGLGFLIALFLMSSVRERLELADVPPTYRGLPIAFVVAGLFALAFMGFSGMSIF
jgi:electron transport complex protein RnfA